MSDVVFLVFMIAAWSTIGYHFGALRQKSKDFKKVRDAFSVHIEANFEAGQSNALIDLLDWIEARW